MITAVCEMFFWTVSVGHRCRIYLKNNFKQPLLHMALFMRVSLF